MNEVHVLEAIQLVEEPSMTKIAKQVYVTTGTLTIAIDGLVRKCYVQRYPDIQDRRKVLLKITALAQSVL